MIIKTHLISGAGNTFHIAFGKIPEILSYAPETIDFVKKVCNKNKADGFIFLQKEMPENTAELYSWNFFNNDGSEAEMCGNATRCVGYYIKNILKSKSNCWHLLTVAGPVKIESVEQEKFKVTMTPVVELKSVNGFYCDTGVPHLVIDKKNILIDENLLSEARNLRQNIEFEPRGTNVTYVVFENNKSKVKAVSYERGVESFTEACGTGAMAAAFYNLTKRSVKQTQVEMPGGTLIMDLSDLKKPTMTGPAVLLGSYSYEISN